ncbi:MAG: hypothetical protein KAU21_12075 [Gammaproteobacteria bacterium]|nr:hypothetical protein [Gammaproteobacteria bacterium]
MNKIFILFFVCVTFFVSSCSDRELSREDEIRQYIERGVEVAEDRSSSDLADLIDESYRDHKGLGKQQVKKMLRAYFFMHKNIYLFTKIRDIKFLSDNEASVTLHVAMAGSVIADASVLSSLRARLYKFELQLIKQDEWLLQQAKWQPASMHDMQ